MNCDIVKVTWSADENGITIIVTYLPYFNCRTLLVEMRRLILLPMCIHHQGQCIRWFASFRIKTSRNYVAWIIGFSASTFVENVFAVLNFTFYITSVISLWKYEQAKKKLACQAWFSYLKSTFWKVFSWTKKKSGTSSFLLSFFVHICTYIVHLSW